MIFTLEKYGQLVSERPNHPQLDEDLFGELCRGYGDYALGLINRRQIGERPGHHIFDSKDSEFQKYIRENIGSIVSDGYGADYTLLFTQTNLDTILKVKKTHPSFYTVSPELDYFAHLSGDLMTKPDIQKIGVSHEELNDDAIYTSVEEKIKIISNIALRFWKAQNFEIIEYPGVYYDFYKAIATHGVKNDLAEWIGFIEHLDTAHPGVQLDIFNESGNLVIGQKKNQKKPRLIWCDTFEPVLMDDCSTQNKKAVWLFRCIFEIIEQSSELLSEEEFRERYRKYYNAHLPNFKVQ